MSLNPSSAKYHSSRDRHSDEPEIQPNSPILDLDQHLLTETEPLPEIYWHQTERERLVVKLQERICQSLNLMEILQTTVAEVRQFLQTDRAIVYRFEPDWRGVVVAESVADGWSSLLGKVIGDSHFARDYVHAYRKGRIQAAADIYNSRLSDCHISLLAQFQIQANLVVPIVQREKLWGLLIAHHCTAPRQWQQHEINLLTSLANQLAIAIQQSELYQQVQQLNSKLEAQVQERTAQLQQALEFQAMLKRITDKVRVSLDETQIWQTAVRELTLVLGVSGCNATLYDLEEGTSTICSEYVAAIPAIRGRVQKLAKFPELYQQLLNGSYFQFCSLLHNPERGRVAMLACPICDDRGVLGDLWLVHHADYEFSELEIQLVQQVASQCAIAIRQARLFQASLAQVEALERINQLKDDFLSVVPHELRTPVANMKMAILMLAIALKNPEFKGFHEESSEASKKRVNDYLKILQDECEREISLISDLLDLQRLNAQGNSPTLEKVNIPAIINQVLAPFHSRVYNRQQNLHVDLTPNLPPLLSNSSYLERILAELVNNACKYTPPGRDITVSACVTSDQVQFQVTNTGVEIALSEQARIFDKFYRIPRADPWKQGGTGLGLALVKTLSEHLGGTVEVKSGEGQTTFTVKLPLGESVL